MTTAVIDASAALNAVMPDEETNESGARLVSDYLSGEIQLVAPTLWAYEVTQGLRKAVTHERVSREVADRSVRFLLGLGVVLTEYAVLAERTWNLALDYKLSIYDACYVALAEQERCQCLTADQRLANAAADTGLVRWIGDYGR